MIWLKKGKGHGGTFGARACSLVAFRWRGGSDRDRRCVHVEGAGEWRRLLRDQRLHDQFPVVPPRLSGGEKILSRG